MAQKIASKPLLKRQVETSKALTPELRRYWLGVLPYLTREECSKLETLLHGAARANSSVNQSPTVPEQAAERPPQP